MLSWAIAASEDNADHTGGGFDGADEAESRSHEAANRGGKLRQAS
jgi:hypothetical protein